MRQVPTNSNYLIVGSGRLATHLRFYINQSQDLTKNHNHSLLEWNRKEHTSENLRELITPAITVLLCLPDQEIIPFCHEFKANNVTFVHFSGALETDLAIGFHPLMTFGYDLFDSEMYSQIPFIGTTQEAVFKEVFPTLKNKYYQITTDQKPLYHGLCVLGGNGTTLLWELVHKEFAKLNLPTEILNPFIKQVLQNIISEDKGRFTGPWYREDKETISKNLQSLKNPNLHTLYHEFLNRAITRGAH